MRQKVLSCLCLVFLLVFSLPVKASETGKHGERDHREWMQGMIFGNASYESYKEEKLKKQLDLLENAILICLDQYNGRYQDKLDELNKEGIPGLPADITSINFSYNYLHRKFTHKGWYHSYGPLEICGNSNPELRKTILRNTVDHVFKFRNYHMPAEKADAMCDAMSCLLYNTHLIADRYFSAQYYGNDVMLLLADDSNAETIISDLQKCLQVLFAENGGSELATLKRELDRLETEIIRERRKNPNDLLSVDIKYAPALKQLLGEHLPALLYKQEWFSSEEVFPLRWNSSVY